MSSNLTVTGPDGVEHAYFGTDTAALEFARERAIAEAGGPVQLVGVAENDTAVNMTLRWTPTDGVTAADNLTV